MKYEEYANIAKDVNADNALEVVQSLLEKAKSDANMVEAEKTDLQAKLDANTSKMKDMQADYIHKFMSVTASEDNSGVDDEAAKAAEAQRLLDIVSANMNS